MYMAYFEPRVCRAVNAGPLRFDIMTFCCIQIDQHKRFTHFLFHKNFKQLRSQHQQLFLQIQISSFLRRILPYLFFFSVRCFSANSTIFSLTLSPLRLRTAFMCLRATFSESAFSPKCRYSSSVVGTQNGSISIT